MTSKMVSEEEEIQVADWVPSMYFLGKMVIMVWVIFWRQDLSVVQS